MSRGEVESSLPQDPHLINNAVPSLGRQSSIYSLTLDEFQHRLCEGSKNFGSMNMDEFLNNIWNHEEGLSIINNNSSITDNSSNNNEVNLLIDETSTEKAIAKQPSLTRQGSLTVPLVLCHKTVDEVWSEIHKIQKQCRKQTGSNVKNSDYATSQSTFGDMTLEDFLVKAGVVREQSNAPVPLPPQHYGLYQTINNPLMDNPTLVSRTPMMETAVASGGKRNGSHHAPRVCYGIGNGGGYGLVQSTREDRTASPVSPDWIATNQYDTRENQFAMEIDRSNGRKRTLDGPVVERRQRRMLKNRESAARSRARKQAYTDELEAELNQLKEENAHLKHTLGELETNRKQQYFEEKSESEATVRLQVMRTQSLPIKL